MNFFWVLGLICLSLGRCIDGFVDFEEWANDTEVGGSESNEVGSNVLNVSITLIPNDKGAVCMDGSPPAYHLHRGFGSGANNWIINLEGGGWCNDISSCNYRKRSRRGSSYFMEQQIPFTGIMSDKPEQNPDFFNWNTVKIRYCDGASFTGEGFDMQSGLFFRGQRIYQVAMEELMSKGMRYAKQALLAGCSAGGLATVHHCDEFRALFSGSTNVKCLADAGLFMDAVDVAGGRTLRSFFGGVVSMQGSGRNLPRACTALMDATLCFFPQNVVQNLQTPMFILNAAYDVWQLQESLVDPHGYWNACKRNHSTCNADQIQFLQGFRNQMLDVVQGFSMSRQNGFFINSCFAHCQMERQDTWFASDGPQIGNQGIAKAVGDWYFDRSAVMARDCPYPCDQTCHNLVARGRD